MSVLLPRLKDFHTLLDRRPQGLLDNIMYTTAGPLDPPLGNTRLQVVRLFAAILQCGNDSIFDEVIRLSTFSTLIVSTAHLWIDLCFFLLFLFVSHVHTHPQTHITLTYPHHSHSHIRTIHTHTSTPFTLTHLHTFAGLIFSISLE